MNAAAEPTTGAAAPAADAATEKNPTAVVAVRSEDAISPAMLSDLRGGSAYRLVTAWGLLMAQSGLFPDSKTGATAAVKILAGWELGFSTVASMTGIHIIDGKPTAGAGLQAAAIKRSEKYDYRVVALDDARCEIEMRERVVAGLLWKWEDIGRSTFSMDDAVKAGLTTGSGAHNWKKYPRNMLFARALSNAVAFFAPDVFESRVYTPDEVRPDLELNERGEFADPALLATDAPPPAPPPAGDATRVVDAESSDVSERDPRLGRFTDAGHFMRMATGQLRLKAQAIFDLFNVTHASELMDIAGGLDEVWTRLEQTVAAAAPRTDEPPAAPRRISVVSDLFTYGGEHGLSRDEVLAILGVETIAGASTTYKGREGLDRAMALLEAAIANDESVDVPPELDDGDAPTAEQEWGHERTLENEA